MNSLDNDAHVLTCSVAQKIAITMLLTTHWARIENCYNIQGLFTSFLNYSQMYSMHFHATKEVCYRYQLEWRKLPVNLLTCIPSGAFHNLWNGSTYKSKLDTVNERRKIWLFYTVTCTLGKMNFEFTQQKWSIQSHPKTLGHFAGKVNCKTVSPSLIIIKITITITLF